ncbi:class I SAM-dependent methyltransferase [Streptomyces cocklensis]|jgi:SAM-dependent methyltransferase|uniref:Methyltransferase domain-containing protein n=1 Tax=Actinacidiphila cocklensis TaxID=887465 RepID=A0A9W4GNT1_9ACTN|nr:class I SAM-dependent methyltransferase [Actinacidiphila cocklensis]MDD1058693.1 class I SAM-dependent methyltransferase [Actinacidiphila cocklensis]WSX75103.1 class I SAM-dependent methyltransferase [Streptomyces sp. NBC_00899]CAG6390882.1 Methyltransferase domain-containing protein [Actinacidiphila cocklensis]
MSEQQGVDVDLGSVDFNIVYDGGELVPGLITKGVPWDTREPQPGVIEFEKRGRIRGSVLDAGCGLGDNAAYLAARGHTVAAFDASSSAIAQAKERHKSFDIEFFVANATEITGYEGRFDTVVDSALYHVLETDDRRQYLEALRRVTKEGAWLDMLVFANIPGGMPAPMSVPDDELKKSIADAGWEITSMKMGTFSGVEAIMDVFVKTFDVVPNTDSKGQIHVPTWLIEAHRV